MTTDTRETIARTLYECEKRRADHSDKVMGLKASTMEPWDECKDTFLSDAAAVLTALSQVSGRETVIEECAQLADKIAQEAADDTEVRNLDINYGRIDAAERIRDAIRARASSPVPAMEGLSRAALDVLAERRRQIEAEGWTPEHDDTHRGGELAIAAACYALLNASSWLGEKTLREFDLWPWDWMWWKPKNRRADLVRAGALLLAEIERIDRAASPEKDAASKGEGR